MIDVQKVVAHAACNSGVVPSFNIPELPSDIEQLATEALIEELIPNMNADRTLDVTVSRANFVPKGGIVLMTPNGVLIDGKPKRLNITATISQFGDQVISFNDALKYKPKQHNLSQSDFLHDIDQSVEGIYYTWGNPLYQIDGMGEVGASVVLKDNSIWTNIGAVPVGFGAETIFARSEFEGNVKWTPGRVVGVYAQDSGIPYSYINLEEFTSINYKYKPYYYSIELGVDYLKIYINNNHSVTIVYPVPIYVENGQIFAPPKFKQFLIDALAFKLSQIYGMTTQEAMFNAKTKSYEMLLRQLPAEFHPTDPRVKIQEALRGGANKSWRFNGFV